MEQVQKTGMDHYRELKAKAKELGITGHMNTEQLEKAIAEAKTGGQVKPAEKGPTGITADEAKTIEVRMRAEEEIRDKVRRERQITIERAEIAAESEVLNIPVELPEHPTELDLAKARKQLGIKKKEIKPSPETVAIEKSKRGYYKFFNREQEDASHTVNLGGKYVIHLVANQVHVLSAYHVKKWGQIAVTPEYGRVPTGVVAGPGTVGQAVEKCVRIGGKERFLFTYLGEAPPDASFGLVTDAVILEKLMNPEE